MRNAFSLMEMMVVLLIVAIVAAATAPMVTKKMARNAGSNDSPWVFTGLGGNIAYNMNGNDNTTVLIGTTSVPNGWAGRARLFVDSGNNAAHIAFGHGNDTPLLLTADPAGRVGFSNAQIPANSVAFGTGQTIDNTSTGTVTIGQGASVGDSRSIAIGNAASVGKTDCIAIGDNASAGEQSNPEIHYSGGSVAIGGEAFAAGHWSIALGNRAGVGKTTKNGERVDDAIAIGTSSRTTADHAIALGDSSNASGEHSTAIGHNAEATGNYSIAIGGGFNILDRVIASAENAIAIGNDSFANQTNATAIGANSGAQHSNSTAINGARTTASHQIVLGTADDTVFIPGHLVAQDIVATRGLYFVDTKSGDHRGLQLLDQWRNPDGRYCAGVDRAVATPSWLSGYTLSGVSDRRLKNVGEKYTAGLDELKKLEFFHYTFKKDENKTPMVGVMAQDLQKVFPDAVTKGDDGYLRIRLEDMFYAVINAVKELDSKITQIVENVNKVNSTIEEQQKVIDAQQNKIAELEKQNADFEKRLAKLEKKNKIVE